MATAPQAWSQVVVRMTTTQQTPCTATTDANGLRLVPGSTDLQATGVTLAGAGCGLQGGGSENYQVAVTAPGNATTGNQFNVTWTASSDAKSCFYGPPVSGVAGWPSGTSACTGAACAGTHSVPVTISTAGTYNFKMICTNATGAAGADVTASGAPPPAPTPADFALSAPASANVGEAFQVSWAVQNATSCQGTATLGGSSVSLPGWTSVGAGVNSATSPRTVTASQAGAYTLSLRCENTSGFVTSQNASVTIVTPPSNSCPAGLQSVGDVSYHVNWTTSSNVARNVDITQFKNIWGRNAPTSTILDWPQRNYAAIFTTYDKTKYIAAKFKVPASGMTSDFGRMFMADNLNGPNTTVSISKTCGEFTPTNLGANCLTTNNGKNDQIVGWKLAGARPGWPMCELTPGEEYYLNIKATDPSATSPDCNGNVCRLQIQNSY